MATKIKKDLVISVFDNSKLSSDFTFRVFITLCPWFHAIINITLFVFLNSQMVYMLCFIVVLMSSISFKTVITRQLKQPISDNDANDRNVDITGMQK